MLAPEPFFQPRGTPISIYFRLRALSDLGHEVDLITYHLGEDRDFRGVQIRRIPDVLGIKRIKIGPSAAKVPLDVLLAGRALGAMIWGGRRYDLIFSHEEGGWIGTALARIWDIPHVYDMHSSLPQQLKNYEFSRSSLVAGVFRRLERWVLKHSAAVIVICPDLENIVRKEGFGHKAVLLENFIDFDDVTDGGTEPSVRQAAGHLSSLTADYGTDDEAKGEPKFVMDRAVKDSTEPGVGQEAKREAGNGAKHMVDRESGYAENHSEHSEAEVRALRERIAPGGEKIVLYAGNFQPYQGIPLLLEAFAELASKPVTLVLVGGKGEELTGMMGLAGRMGLEVEKSLRGEGMKRGSSAEQIDKANREGRAARLGEAKRTEKEHVKNEEQIKIEKAMATEERASPGRYTGLGCKVIFTGQVPPSEISLYIRAADALVSPRTSGTNTPLKIYSFLKSGKPLVATRLWTHTQVLSDEVAILAEPDAHSLAEGIKKALFTEEGRKRAAAAKARADREYTYPRYLEKIRQVLGMAVGTQGQKGPWDERWRAEEPKKAENGAAEAKGSE